MQPAQIRLAASGLFLLLIPLMLWLTDHTWRSSDHIQHAENPSFIFWQMLTHTGTMPYAVLTAIVVFAWLFVVIRRSHRWQVIVMMCLLSVAVTQAVKIAVKEMTRQPRPYVHAVQPHNPDAFYQHSEARQRQHIAQRFPNPDIHENLQTELGYAFPSGHTIFVASWLMLFAGFLPPRRWVWLLPIALWAAGVSYSRVLLGMHYPIDLAAAIVMAWLWHAFLFARILPRLMRRFPANWLDAKSNQAT